MADLTNNKQKINNTQWKLEFYIYNKDIIQENIKFDEVSSSKPSSFIPTKNVLYFSVDNSMSEFYPTAIVKILDEGYGVSNKIRRQNTFLHVKIKKLLNNEGTSEAAFDQSLNLTFLIVDYKIVSYTETSITYELLCESILSVLLNKICQYATDVDVPEDPIRIAYKILNNAGYPLYPCDQGDSPWDMDFPSPWALPDTETTINFITYQNMTVKNALKYLLSITGKKCESPVYLINNLYDNRAFLSSRTHLMKNGPMYINEDFSFSSFQSTIFNNMKFLKTNGDIGGSEEAKLFANYSFANYDHNTRKWYNEDWSRDALNKALTSFGKRQNERSLFDYGIGKRDDKTKYEFIPYSEQFLNDVLRDLDLYSSNIQFTVEGNVRLDVGTIINISEKLPDGAKLEQFFGEWLITKVRHSFKDQLFKTNIICTRTTFLEKLAIKK